MTPIEIIHQQLELLPGDKVILKDCQTQVRAAELLQVYRALGCVIQEELFCVTGLLPSADVPVALLLRRDVNLVTTVLALWGIGKLLCTSQVATLVSGLTVVPLSEDWPTARVIEAVSSLDAILITDRVALPYCMLLSLDTLLEKASSYRAPIISQSKQRMAASDLLYITFTSGSTGRPKAVCTEASGVVNLIANYTSEFHLHGDMIVYQVVNPAFDIFFADCLMALCNGGTLLMARGRIPNIEELSKSTSPSCLLMKLLLQDK